MYTVDTNLNRIFTVVEIKYCRDTNTEDQWARATQQHKDLVDALTAYQPKGGKIQVRQETILLGATCAIYNNTVETLQHLGVHGRALDTLLRDLHYIAVQGVENAW